MIAMFAQLDKNHNHRGRNGMYLSDYTQIEYHKTRRKAHNIFARIEQMSLCQDVQIREC